MKKKLLALLLTIGAIICLCFALVGCNSFSDSKSTTYYEYNSYTDSIDTQNYITLKNGDWNDADGIGGTYTMNDDKITLYLELRGEKTEYFTATIKDGVMKYKENNTDIVYVTTSHSHSFGSWYDKDELTCTQDKTRACSCICGKEEKQIITAAKGHNGVLYLTETTHYYVCTKCKQIFDENIHLGEDKCNICDFPFGDTLTLEFEVNKEQTAYTVKGIGTTTDKIIRIPKIHNGLPVTSIGNYAFMDEGLIYINIPDSVTHIGDDAFKNCSELKSIYYLGDITSWCRISGLENLFDNLTGYGDYGGSIEKLYINNQEIIGDLVIPDSVTSISSGAFLHCNKLTSVTIPDSVTSIGSRAFRGCSGLKSIYFLGDITSWCRISGLENLLNNSGYGGYGGSNKKLYINNQEIIGDLVIPDSVTSISSGAFLNCNKLTNVTIPDSVTSIGDYAFKSCSNLTSVTIGNGVTRIGDYAFDGCSNLTSITIPDSVTRIGNSAFSGCCNLTSVTIGNGVTRIGDYAFDGCSNLTNITIPDSVTRIGNSAFSGCSGLTSITIPDGVKIIDNNAFTRCSGLTSITIPDSVTSIGRLAFQNCSNLTSITIGNGVTSIGNYAFIGCSNLTSIMFNGTKEQWNAIHKYDSWNSITGNYVVQCTDGKLDKNGNVIE